MFLGYDAFCGYYNTAPANMDSKIDELALYPGDYSVLYMHELPNKTFDNFDDEWDIQTRMKLDFKDKKLNAGNSVFSERNTDTMIVKIREKGAVDWKTIYEFPINNAGDLITREEYKYAKNDTEYEFMVVSLLNGMTTGFELLVDDEAVMSKFDRIVLCDKETLFSTAIEIDPILFTRNINVSRLETLHGKYPTVVSYDDNNYKSGNLSAMFVAMTEECDIEDEAVEHAKLREEITDWLCNKKAKILKDSYGNILLFQVASKPTEEPYDENYPNFKKIAFEFVETGDVNSEYDLYVNDLSDVPPEKY